MKTFLFKRIKYYLVMLLFPFYALLFVFDQVFNPGGFIGLSLIIPMFFPFLQIKNSWFLLFPYSRKKLIAYHILETLVLSIIHFLMLGLAVYYFYLKYGSSSNVPKVALIVGFLNLWIWVILFSAATSFMPYHKIGAYSVLEMFKRRPSLHELLAFFGACVAVLVMAWVTFSFEAFLIQASFGVVFFFFFLLIPAAVIVMPMASFKKWRRFCLVSAMICLIGLVSATYSLIHVGEPDSSATEIAFYLLGDLPDNLSQERLLSLARIPNGVATNKFNKLSDESKSNVSEEEWFSRTEKCESQECLNVSHFLVPSRLPDEKTFEKFYYLMKKCEFKMNEKEELRCSGLIPSRGIAQYWLDNLYKSGFAMKWLQNSDPLKQAVAIRSLACRKLDFAEKALIVDLKKSKSDFVQVAASLHEMNYQYVEEATMGKEKNRPCLNLKQAGLL